MTKGRFRVSQLRAPFCKDSKICLSYGICKWTIVVESLSDYGVDVGFVKKGWNDDDFLSKAGWCFSVYPGGDIKRTFGQGRQEVSNHGVRIKNGDAITFHLDLNNRTCSLSINEHNYGIAWINLLENLNLYPAVNMGKRSKYRIKPYGLLY